MAPKRKRVSGTGEVSTTTTTSRETRSAVRTGVRATRSATRRGDAALNPPVSDPEPPKTKKAKTSSAAAASAGASSSASDKAVIIEHCVQCDSFKKKANEVKKGLKKAVSGVNIVVNPEPPRKGCFEIREEGGDVFVSLVDMKSPFEATKALDVKKVVSDVIERIK